MNLCSMFWSIIFPQEEFYVYSFPLITIQTDQDSHYQKSPGNFFRFILDIIAYYVFFILETEEI